MPNFETVIPSREALYKRTYRYTEDLLDNNPDMRLDILEITAVAAQGAILRETPVGNLPAGVTVQQLATEIKSAAADAIKDRGAQRKAA